jgi:hypothetical protein
MAQTVQESGKSVNLGFSATPAVIRLVDELVFTLRIFNRSKVMRVALIELADRELPKDWRERLGWEDESAA